MLARVLPIAIALLVASCEKVDHENLDKWTRTQRGPDKLKQALANEDIDAQLSAHAAANLVKLAMEPDVRAAFETMSPGRRGQVIEALAPMLWDIARVEDELELPAGPQVGAKDMLVSLRRWADDAQRARIDGYLIDWYGVASYEGRAVNGSYSGATVMRMVGPAGGRKLTGVMNTLIATPGQDKVKLRIGDQLMLGMAASGNPDAVKYVLQIAKMDRGDPTLGPRAMRQLRRAFIDPESLFDLQEPTALEPNLDALVALAKDESQPGTIVNTAIALIAVVPPPRCFAPLVGMIGAHHRDSRFKYVAASNALKCGGPKAISEVVKALPEGAGYWREELTGAISGEIAKMTPREQALASVRELLGARSTVAKWVAIEALVAMKSKDDVVKIAALSGNRERLVGYWGDEGDGRPDPTLGQHAKALAATLAGATKPPH